MVVLTRSGWVVFRTDRHCGGRVWRVRRRANGSGYEMGMLTSCGRWWSGPSWHTNLEYRDQAEHAKAYYQTATGNPTICPACARADAVAGHQAVEEEQNGPTTPTTSSCLVHADDDDAPEVVDVKNTSMETTDAAAAPEVVENSSSTTTNVETTNAAAPSTSTTTGLMVQKWQARLTPEILAEVLPPPGTPFASNRNYRNCLRRVFDMDAAARTNFGDGAAVLDPSVEMDAETADELAFDTAAADTGLREWYDLSSDDPEYLTLYDRVGYSFITLNSEVGAAALGNFDDFAPYCRAFAAYVRSLDPVTGLPPRGGSKFAYAPELFALLNKFRPRDS